MKLPHLHHENILSLNASACYVLSQSEQENEQEFRIFTRWAMNFAQKQCKIRKWIGVHSAHATEAEKKTINNLNCKLKRIAGYNWLHMFIVMFMRGERKYQACALEM